MRWQGREASYWWPNKLFREDYAPNLFVLNLTASSNLAGPGPDSATTTAGQRYGFVKSKKNKKPWGEARRPGTWHEVNGRRINSAPTGSTS